MHSIKLLFVVKPFISFWTISFLDSFFVVVDVDILLNCHTSNYNTMEIHKMKNGLELSMNNRNNKWKRVCHIKGKERFFTYQDAKSHLN